MTNYLYEMISEIKFINLNTMPQYYLAENHTVRERVKTAISFHFVQVI